MNRGLADIINNLSSARQTLLSILEDEQTRYIISKHIDKQKLFFLTNIVETTELFLRVILSILKGEQRR